MSAKQTKDGWKVDFRCGGADGKRYRKTCPTKAEAERYQKFVEAKHVTTGKPWESKPKDKRLLSELVSLWSEHFGAKLIKHNDRRLKLNYMVSRLGNPIAAQLTPAEFNRFLSSRLNEGKKPSTINESIMCINAVYNGLFRIGEIDFENPVSSIKKMKDRQSEMQFLTTKQTGRLLSILKSDNQNEMELVVRVCLSTGSRWGEAAGLTDSRVQNNKVIFTETKNGKNRSIPIATDLFEALKEHSKKVKTNKLFSISMTRFNSVLVKAEIDLPKGQKTHVLRHTFASHFMINGGNILSLKEILGHSDISMTMRYAHLSPNHLTDAIKYSVLNGVD